MSNELKTDVAYCHSFIDKIGLSVKRQGLSELSDELFDEMQLSEPGIEQRIFNKAIYSRVSEFVEKKNRHFISLHDLKAHPPDLLSLIERSKKVFIEMKAPSETEMIDFQLAELNSQITSNLEMKSYKKSLIKFNTEALFDFELDAILREDEASEDEAYEVGTRIEKLKMNQEIADKILDDLLADLVHSLNKLKS